MKGQLLFTVLLLLAFQAFSQNDNALSLWYDKPASKWIEALPIGNGSLGAMIYGGTTKEVIQFNESSLITGSKEKVGFYQPFGDIIIESMEGKGELVNYKRILNLDSAIHLCTYSINGVQYRREYWASYPDKVIAVKFSASKAQMLSFKVRLIDAHKAATKVGNQQLQFTSKLENGMVYSAAMHIQQQGGKLETDSTGIVVKNATEVVLYLSAATSFVLDADKNFTGQEPVSLVQNRLASVVPQSFQELKKRHLADHQLLFSRVKLNLGNGSNLPTNDRLANYKINGQDRALEALLFQYGRYLLIASSRKGGLPANLQGIWNAEFKPAWYSQYTTNINVEMNYWLAEPTNLSECHLPLFDWIENLAKVQKASADPKLQTKKGWIAYSTNNIMGGPSTWGLHRPGSAWLSQHFWEHYAFTGNKAFLVNRAYPMLKDVVGYWEDHLIKTNNGKWITPDGWSPEHGPGMKEGDRTPYPGVSYDQQIVHDLFSNYLEAAAVLKKDAAYVTKISQMHQQILGPQIGKWGQLQEWMDDVDDPNDKHRHNSHLFAVHPGRQISPITTPEWAKAAMVSLNARGDKSTGWSTAWKINLFARLHQGNKAYALIGQLFNNCILHNLFDTHPPFQIDGNFGYSAGVAEMLLQSHSGFIHLLPALPDAWRNGYISGLKARGNVSIDIAWENGQLRSGVLQAANSGSYLLRYGSRQVKCKLIAGKKYAFNQQLELTAK